MPVCHDDKLLYNWRVNSLPRRLSRYLQDRRIRVLAANVLLIAAIAYLDWNTRSNRSLGYLYLFPMLVGGYYLGRLKILWMAVLCTVLRESAAPAAWQTDAAIRAVMSLFGYFGAGLFVSELARARRLAEEQSLLRQAAEQQLRALIESSPAAILMLDAEGTVLLANESAHRLLGFAPDSLRGEAIARFLPVLAAVLPRSSGNVRLFRSTIECTGRRQDGDVFLAQVFFSTYRTVAGPRLAAIVWDGSDELRDREGLGLHSVMKTSQILVRAALHEVRNLGAAAAVAHTNLSRLPAIANNDDFQALGTLVKGLEKIASAELRLATDSDPGTVDLHTVLDALRIVIEPSFRESGIAVRWNVANGAPPVRGDHHGLLQVFLNLAQNSHRAMQGVETKEFTVTTCEQKDWLLIRFQDTGRGIPVPDRLFQPMQPGAEATGLGLYVSRAIVRSFAGDLRYEPQPLGSCFTVKLAPVRAAVAMAS